MIVEHFLYKQMKSVEKFEDSNNVIASNWGLTILIIIIIFGFLYTVGAVLLSWNYNTYIGSSFGLKIIYAILVLLFPSFYYPLYALVLNPIKGYRNSSKGVAI